MHPQTRPHVPSPASPMWAPLGSPAPSDELQATGGGRWASGWCAWAGGLACAGDKITRNRVCGTPGSALPFPHSDQIQARSRLDRCYRLHLSNEDTWAWVCPSRVAEAQAGRPGLTPKSPSPRAAASGVLLHAGPASKCSGLVSGSSVFAEAPELLSSVAAALEIGTTKDGACRGGRPLQGRRNMLARPLT